MDTKLLEGVALFQHVGARRLHEMLNGALLERYEKGAPLFYQGERAEAVWIVLKGWVHLTRSAKDRDAARAVVLFTITPREVLCGVSAIDAGVYNLSAVAGADCSAIRIPGERFRDALMHEPGFAYEVVRLCARRIQHIALQYGSMAEPVTVRIARAILRLQQQFGATLPVTHRELAQMSWTTTESAIRAVRTFKRQGYVIGTRGQLSVRKPKALESLLVGSANGAMA